MNSKRIAVFCHNLEINGANRFVYTLIESMVSGGAIAIFSNRDGKMRQKFERLGLSVEVVGEGYDFSALESFDVVVVNSLMMSRVVLECVSRRIAHVLVVHETWRPENMEYYIKDLWNIDGVSMQEIVSALRESQKIVFPASYLSKVYESLVDESRASTIYCTIETEKIDACIRNTSKVEARDALGIAAGSVLFLQVGTVTRRKSQLSTLEAFLRLNMDCRLHGQMDLMFVGARNFRPGEREYIREIERRAREAGVESRVHVLGVQDDIYRYFVAADVLVHPSVNEVLPLAVLEAAYCRVPIIASNLDGMPEVIRDGCEGLLINPYDIDSICEAMKKMALDEGLRKHCGDHARLKVVQQHGKDKFVEAYWRLISDAVRGEEGACKAKG